MYNNEHYDHLFYPMKQNIPSNSVLFLLVTCIKLYPLFLLSHTGGYSTPPEELSTIHHSFRYFSLTYYLQNSFGSGNILIVIEVIFGLNVLLVIALGYFFTFANKAKQLEENYGAMNVLGYPFYIFSNIVFFKYVILFQFFIEINFISLICIEGAVDYSKIAANSIYTAPSFSLDITNLCTSPNLIVLLILSALNLIIDVCFHFLITSRFFDFNILSSYKWNFYPSLIFSFEFLESCAQLFFVLFLNYNNSVFKVAFDVYLLCLFILHVYKRINSNFFHTSSTKVYVIIAEYARDMSYIAGVFIVIFQFASGTVPNDINILGLIIFEAIIAFLFISFFHRKDKLFIRNILVTPLNQLKEKNIYGTLIFLITEFKTFNDIFKKFTDNNLDLFLENYVDHLKICEDLHCPCKNYVKKITGASNTIKSGYTTVINFTHMKKDQKEEYILNKFFNVLAANINATLKFTNNVNLNNIQDTQKRQKLIYQLRIKLVAAVKKLISYKLEKLTRDIDGPLGNAFKKETKDFIRINFYSVSISCNKNYYKTQFLYHEFLSEYFKHHDTSYHLNMIYYFYLKKFAFKEYNEHITTLRQGKKEHSSSGLHLDFRTVLSLCVKYYEIEEGLINAVNVYREFILYFNRENIIFDDLFVHVKQFRSSYKSVAQYISHFFKNDKINNLFVCTKIILFYKILHFDIPETLHNKLIIQLHDADENSKMHSYIDSNYYMILNYIKGEFVIKFISHELLIVLEYSEEELRNKDFHVLLPEKIVKVHKSVLINEIKSRALSSNLKEIFFISKRQTCVLFDIQYKFLLNLKGEITLLTVVNLKKPSKDFRICFACIDDHGQVLALNKEFEEYLVLSMKLLDYVKIDTEKLILQTMGPRMRNFFKDPENSDFQEQFDYDLYLSSLFDEEFEILKEKNEKEYKKKYMRWEVLKEMNRKGKCYTKYIELNIKQRLLGRETIYFLKYSVKITLSLRSIEPHSTTLSLIHAVKISKREMAKLSFFKGDDLYDHKERETINEEKVDEQDDLFESQSQISSAVSQLKERNLVRLFKQKKNKFEFVPKGRFIFTLIFLICIFVVGSVIYNILSLIYKKKFYEEAKDFLSLMLNAQFLKKNIFTLSSALISKALVDEQLLDFTMTQQYPVNYPDNLIDLIEREKSEMNSTVYTLYLLNSFYFIDTIDSLMNTVYEMKFIFTNGLTYPKSKRVVDDIAGLTASSLYESSDSLSSPIIKDYFLMNQIEAYQPNILQGTLSLSIPSQLVYVYFLLHNLYESVEDYSNRLIDGFNAEFSSRRSLTNLRVSLMKGGELLLVIIIILIEWLFIKFGYKNAKKKMMHLLRRVRYNNIELTMKKIGEFLNFSNTLNIGSLYYIADLDLKRVEDSSKTPDYLQSSTSKNAAISTPALALMTPRKKNISSQLKDKEYDSLTNYNIEIKSLAPKMSYLDIGNANDNKPQSLEPPDGKKNLMKVMQKLDQIKHIKRPKELEKKESEKSRKSLDSSGLCNSEINNALLKSHSNEMTHDNDDDIEEIIEGGNQAEYREGIVNDFIKKSSSTSEEEHNSHIRDEQEPEEKQEQKEPRFYLQDPIKSALKLTEGNFPIQIIDSDKIKKMSTMKIGIDESVDEDSKMNMMKPNEDTIGLMQPKRNNRKPKVQFKEKKVVYYSPMQNVYDGFEYGAQMKNGRYKKEQQPKESTEANGANDKPENQSQEKLANLGFNDKPKDKTLLSAIQANSPEVKMKDLTSENKAGSNNQTQGKGNQFPNHKDSNHMDINNLKDSHFGKFNMLGQEGVVTVKKKQDKAKKIKKEEIESKIDNVVHKNDKAKVILILTLILFLISYITSINLNCVYNNQIRDAGAYSTLLVNQSIIFVAVQLRYRLDLMLNLHTDHLSSIITQADSNKNSLKTFEVNEKPNVLNKAFLLHSSLISNSSCESFSQEYSQAYSLSAEQELNECVIVAEQMNSNGIESGMTYYLSTIATLIDDWRNFGSIPNEINPGIILAKLNSLIYFKLVIENDYTLRKYASLIVKYIQEDVIDIFKTIFFNESIFDFLNITMNILFLISSLIFIIYPIKAVELMISWLIHKLVKG